MKYSCNIGESCNDIATFIHMEIWNPSYSQTIPLWVESFIESLRNEYHWCRMRSCTFLALELVLSGNLCFKQDGVYDVVNYGELYLIQKAEDSLLKTGPAGYYRKIAIVIQGSLIDSILVAMSLNKKFKVKLSNPGRIEQLMRDIGDLIARKQIEDISHINGLTFELLSIISTDASEKGEMPQELIAAVQLLEANVGKRLSVKELAGAVGCSCATLNRQFNTYYKISPNAYQIKLRMAYAGQLILSSSMMLKEIADRLGYQNQMYFSNDFKKFFKMSPSEYRSRNIINP